VRVSAEQIRTLFPRLTKAQVARALLQTRVNEARNRIYAGFQHQLGLGPGRLVLLPTDDLTALRPPLIFGTFHVGPTLALGAAMERLPGEVLVLRRRSYKPAQAKNVSTAETEGSEERRAQAFHRAVMHLRGGGYALLPIDPLEASRVAAPFFGRSLLLARGAFALSRVARVPIVPLITRWRGVRVEVFRGPRIEPSDSEEALAAEAARWLEQYLDDAPGEVTPRVFELMV
jgi:lauroyl/myristoyl acyltransferase